MQVTMSGDMMANMSEAERALYETMPALVTAVAVFLVWYSRDAKAKGWLS
jgi:hypothetical protein